MPTVTEWDDDEGFEPIRNPRKDKRSRVKTSGTVSYTHLTLPTI